MATQDSRPKPPATTNDSIRRCNRRVARRFRVTLRIYKIIKAIVQWTAVGAGIYAMSLGAEPLTTFIVIGVIVSGPEALEYFIDGQDNSS